MEKLFYEDYAVGEKMRSPGRTITETDLVLFSAFTGDWHPLNTIFGERIAHGMLTLCVGSALMFRLGMYAALPKSFIAFYGMDSVRFVGATKIGDTIRCEVEIENMEERIWSFTRRRSSAAEDPKYRRTPQCAAAVPMFRAYCSAT